MLSKLSRRLIKGGILFATVSSAVLTAGLLSVPNRGVLHEEPVKDFDSSLRLELVNKLKDPKARSSVFYDAGGKCVKGTFNDKEYVYEILGSDYERMDEWSILRLDMEDSHMERCKTRFSDDEFTDIINSGIRDNKAALDRLFGLAMENKDTMQEELDYLARNYFTVPATREEVYGDCLFLYRGKFWDYVWFNSKTLKHVDKSFFRVNRTFDNNWRYNCNVQGALELQPKWHSYLR